MPISCCLVSLEGKHTLNQSGQLRIKANKNITIKGRNTSNHNNNKKDMNLYLSEQAPLGISY